MGSSWLDATTCRIVQEQGETCNAACAASRRPAGPARARTAASWPRTSPPNSGSSEDTVRRDLRELAAAGLCQRVYGGALPASPAVADYAPRGRASSRPARSGSPPGRVALSSPGQHGDPGRRHDHARRRPRAAGGPGLHGGHAQPHRRGRSRRRTRASRSCCSAGGCSSTRPSPAAPPRSRPRRGEADLFLLGVTGVHPTAGLTTGDAEEAAMNGRSPAGPPTPTCWPAPRRSAPPRRTGACRWGR